MGEHVERDWMSMMGSSSSGSGEGGEAISSAAPAALGNGTARSSCETEGVCEEAKDSPLAAKRGMPALELREMRFGVLALAVRETKKLPPPPSPLLLLLLFVLLQLPTP